MALVSLGSFVRNVFEGEEKKHTGIVLLLADVVLFLNGTTLSISPNDM